MKTNGCHLEQGKVDDSHLQRRLGRSLKIGEASSQPNLIVNFCSIYLTLLVIWFPLPFVLPHLKVVLIGVLAATMAMRSRSPLVKSASRSVLWVCDGDLSVCRTLPVNDLLHGLVQPQLQRNHHQTPEIASARKISR